MLDPVLPLARLARRAHQGTLLFGDLSAVVRWVIDPRTGHLLTPVEHAVLDHRHDLRIAAPDETDDSLQLSLTAEPIPDWKDCPSCDRWLAYYHRPDKPVWLRMTIAGARLGFDVYDLDDLDARNPLAADETALIKHANARRSALEQLIHAHTGQPGLEPLTVGADPWGLDIRTRIGVLRLEFPDPTPNAGTPSAAVRDHAATAAAIDALFNPDR